MKRFLLVATVAFAAAFFAPGRSFAQDYSYGGALLDQDIMMPTEIASLVQNQSFGTARSMAMGGAFTSLGADMSSISQNPAGLGMFMQEVFSFTPTLSFSNAETASVPTWTGNNRTTFGFSNMGGVFKMAENGKGSLIAVNAAISYNKIADYNFKSSFTSDEDYNSPNGLWVPSIMDVFAIQLMDIDYNPDVDKVPGPYYWPAYGAYDTWMLDRYSDGSWATGAIGDSALISSSYENVQRGSAGEYAFAIGANVGNFLYLGATLGIQAISKSTELLYQEEYLYDEGVDVSSLAQYSLLWQRTELDGAGANLKVGMIMRPTRAVRIGVAFHSPTYYSINRLYETQSEAKFFEKDGDGRDHYISEKQYIIDDYSNSWKFRTPSKLLVGGSFQIGAFGVVSLDYERQWYNWTRVTSTPTEDQYPLYNYKVAYETDYQPSNTIRAGLEVKPMSAIALRVGGGYSSSMIKDEAVFYTPMPTTSGYISCGAGFQLSKSTTFDLAYQYLRQNYSSYELYYVADPNGNVVSNSLQFNTNYNRNYIIATLTFRL